MPATWIPGYGRLQNGVLVNTAQEQANADAELAAMPNEGTLRTRVDQAVTNLENAWTNWDTLTPAQKDAAQKLCVRVTAGLARLQLRKLDSVG
jgi:hypothetical protein